MDTNEESFACDKPSRPWLKRLAWCLLIGAIFAAVPLVWNLSKKAGEPQKTMVEIDGIEPGWRLEEIEAAREDVPEDENSARVVAAAAQLLPQAWPAQDFAEHFQHLPPAEKLTDMDFDRLTKELQRVRPALAVADKLVDMPRGRYPIHYERNPILTLLPHRQESRHLGSLFIYEAMRQNQIGETTAALTSCRAALNAARSLGDEPILISQLIRTAGVIYACQAIERTLAQGEPLPHDMAVLQKLLENEDAFPSLLIATRGERAALHKAFEAVEHGYVSVDELALTRSSWLERTFISLWRMDTLEDNALFLSLMSRRIADIQLPLHEQAATEKRFDQEVRALPKAAVITRLLTPAMSDVGEAFRRKHACLRCMIIALAAERYRQANKCWPEFLDQLCPKYLDAVLLDPFDGQALRYRRFEHGVVVYSVAADGVENNGNIALAQPNKFGVDIGCHLWDVAKRRQPPKLKPPKANPDR